MTGLSWNRRHPDKIREAHRKFEKTAKRRRYLKGRGVLARKMSDKLRYEIKMGRFPKAEACLFAVVDGQNCYGRVVYAHQHYRHWAAAVALCRHHHSRFDFLKPKTINPAALEAKRNVKAA